MKKSKKIVLISLISVVVVVLVCLLTIFIFKETDTTTTTKPDVTTTENKLPTVDNISKIFEDYSKLEISDRENLYNERLKVNSTEASYNNSTVPTNSKIYYQANKNTYEIDILASNYIQFEKINKTDSKNSNALKTATEKFLLEKKFLKLDVISKAEIAKFTPYNSENVVCQISDYEYTTELASLYGLACVEKSVITDQYKLYNELLALNKSSNKKPVSIYINQDISDDNKKLKILSAKYSETDSNLLIFASLDNKWEFISERPTPNMDDRSSFEISDSLKAAISNSKWDGFLESYIK